MPIDLTKLDERIARLTELRRVLSDPEVANLAKELLGVNGSAGTATPKVPQHGSFTDIVRSFVWKQAGEFTVEIVTLEMQKTIPTATRKAVGKALNYLDVNGEIKALHRGGSGKPNIYVKTEKLKRV